MIIRDRHSKISKLCNKVKQLGKQPVGPNFRRIYKKSEKYHQDDCDRQLGEPKGVPAGRPGPHHKDPEPGAAGRELQAAQEGRERGNLTFMEESDE